MSRHRRLLTTIAAGLPALASCCSGPGVGAMAGQLVFFAFSSLLIIVALALNAGRIAGLVNRRWWGPTILWGLVVTHPIIWNHYDGDCRASMAGQSFVWGVAGVLIWMVLYFTSIAKIRHYEEESKRSTLDASSGELTEPGSAASPGA